MLELNVSISYLSRRFDCSRKTIRGLKNRFNATGDVADRPRPGRQRVFNERRERQLLRAARQDRWRTGVEHGIDFATSAKTVLRVLSRYGLKPRRPYWGPILTQERRRKRRIFSRLTEPWSQEWSQILFTDECRFSLNTSDRRVRVFRTTGERYSSDSVLEHDRWKSKNVMVWAGITHDFRTEIVFIDGNLNAEAYVEQCLDPHVVPFMQTHNNVWILQQDNARPHTATHTSNFLESQGIRTLPWPSYSPDLNPIEHLWDFMKRRIRKMSPPPRNVRELKEAIWYTWTTFPQSAIQRLIQSMPRRVRSVNRARGGHTRY